MQNNIIIRKYLTCILGADLGQQQLQSHCLGSFAPIAVQHCVRFIIDNY